MTEGSEARGDAHPPCARPPLAAVLDRYPRRSIVIQHDELSDVPAQRCLTVQTIGCIVALDTLGAGYRPEHVGRLARLSNPSRERGVGYMSEQASAASALATTERKDRP